MGDGWAASRCVGAGDTLRGAWLADAHAGTLALGRHFFMSAPKTCPSAHMMGVATSETHCEAGMMMLL